MWSAGYTCACDEGFSGDDVVDGVATCVGARAPTPGAGAAATEPMDCSSDSTTYSYTFEDLGQQILKTRCVPSSLAPEMVGLGNQQAARFILTFTAESGEYRTTRITSSQMVEVYGADSGGAKVNFRGGFNVGGICGITSSESERVHSCAGSASLALEGLAFRGLRSAGGGGFYSGSHSPGMGMGGYPTAGGAVFVGSTGTLIATDVEFADNALVRSDDGGAVFLASGAIASFLRVSFTGNIAGVPPLSGLGGFGGAIYAANGVSLTIASCEFANNIANYGGAIFANPNYGPRLSISDTTFSGNAIRTTGSSYSGSQAIYRSGGSSGERYTDASAVSAQPILIERP